jgi:hypothetical protein
MLLYFSGSPEERVIQYISYTMIFTKLDCIVADGEEMNDALSLETHEGVGVKQLSDPISDKRF